MQKLLANKKQAIITGVLCIALLVGIIILVSWNSKETCGKDTGIKTEQNKGDTEFSKDKDEAAVSGKGNGNSELEVLQPDDAVTEDSSDASGSWGNESGTTSQTGDTNTTEKAEQNDNNQDDEGILKDDITWGDIY